MEEQLWFFKILSKTFMTIDVTIVIQASWTGYMLMKVRHDLPEIGFVKVPCDDRGSIRVFVNISAEHIVEFGQSQASVCLWWNVNSSSNDRWKLLGQIEWAADNGEIFQIRRAGMRQNGDGVTPFLVDHETHSTTFGFTTRLFCPSVKQKIYQTALHQCPGPRM